MKSIRAAGLVALFLAGALTASAHVTVEAGSPNVPQPFSFYCDPYTAPFVSGGEYVPLPQNSSICHWTIPQTGNLKILAIYKGTPGNAIPVQWDFTVGNASSLFTNPNNFAGAQHGDDFFAAAYSAADEFEGSLGDFYLQFGLFGAPAQLEILQWKFGMPPVSSDITPPQIIITSPVAGSTYLTTDSVFPIANITDASAITEVHYFLNGTEVSHLLPLDLASQPLGAATVSVSATDEAGNTGTASALFTIKKELTVKADSKTKLLGAEVPPLTTTITGFVNGETLGTSGIAGAPECTTTATAESPIGDYPITCSLGTLSSDRYAFTFVNGTLSVDYLWVGFGQPINDTGHSVNPDVSVFKSGSTVPVKITLKDAAGNVITDAPAPVWLTPQKGAPMTDVIDELYYSDPVTSGNDFVQQGDHYQFNWGTKGLQTGYWYRIFALLPDGTIRSVTIGLR